MSFVNAFHDRRHLFKRLHVFQKRLFPILLRKGSVRLLVITRGRHPGSVVVEDGPAGRRILFSEVHGDDRFRSAEREVRRALTVPDGSHVVVVILLIQITDELQRQERIVCLLIRLGCGGILYRIRSVADPRLESDFGKIIGMIAFLMVPVRDLVVFRLQFLFVRIAEIMKRVARIHVAEFRRHFHVAADAVVTADLAGRIQFEGVDRVALRILLQIILDLRDPLGSVPMHFHGPLEFLGVEAERVVSVSEDDFAPDVALRVVQRADVDLVRARQILEGRCSLDAFAVFLRQVEALDREMLFIALRPGTLRAENESLRVLGLTGRDEVRGKAGAVRLGNDLRIHVLVGNLAAVQRHQFHLEDAVVDFHGILAVIDLNRQFRIVRLDEEV